MSLDKLRAKVNKDAGQDVILSGNEIMDVPRIPTPSFVLNCELGGGVPEGRITTVSGEYMDGKTAVVMMTAGNYQRLRPNKIVVWVDAEGVFDPLWARQLGLDPDKVFLVRPQYAEQGFDIMLSALEEPETGFVVLDSIKAMTPKSELEGEMEDITVALQARLNAKFLRKAQSSMLDASEIPPTVCLINQLTTNVGGYGNPIIESGGKALQYYPSVKIRFHKGDFYPASKGQKDEGVEPKAQQIKFHITKNKTAPPHRRGHFWFYFDTLDKYRTKGSVDNLEEMVRYATKWGIVHRPNPKGSIYNLYNPDTGELIESFKGSGKLAAAIRENEDYTRMITEAVMKKVNDPGEVPPSETEKKREETVQETQPTDGEWKILESDEQEEGREAG